MFVLDLSDSYSWPVEFNVPVGVGEYALMKFEVEFQRLESDEVDYVRSVIAEYSTANGVGMPLDGLRHPRELIFDVQKPLEAVEGEEPVKRAPRPLVVGWSKVQNKSKAEVPFSDAALQRLMKIPDAEWAIIAAWGKSLSGGRVKN